MQPTPIRLSQALWTAFRAAKPTHRQPLLQRSQYVQTKRSTPQWPRQVPQISVRAHARFYSDKSKDIDVEKKVEEAKRRIDESLDSRADLAQDAEPMPEQQKDETIVHTLPEASSIVHTKEASADKPQSSTHSEKDRTRPKPEPSEEFTNGNKYAAWASSRWQSSPLPSQIASLRSRASQQFSSTMDNLQSQIVVAAHHLNDLTGYSAIERLKKEIETQENDVKAARQHVKDTREEYSEAISQRSATQREVNDLLHRKHSWSPTDLERFTHLYRSDHANEQAEQKSQQRLSDAETSYEEASTRLAKSILARYHEEQIWSDKIRQMSTWGTWGLMGLNVLLFIIFQIAIEPWRRRRLVKGFEEKVQKALDEKERVTDEKLAVISAAQQQRNGDQIVSEAVRSQPEGVVAAAAEDVAELIADAVSGTTESPEQVTEAPKPEDIETAAEQVAEKELEDEAQGTLTTASTAISDSLDPSLVLDPSEALPLSSDSISTSSTDTPSLDADTIPLPPQNWQQHLQATYHNAIRKTTETYAHYSALIARQFTDKEHVVLSKREITAKVLEGVAAGVAVTCGVVFVVIRTR